MHLFDARANALLSAAPQNELQVQALASSTQLALRLEWSDAQAELLSVDEVNAFADAVALEVPTRYGAGVRLPYVGMGDAEQTVELLLARARRREAACKATWRRLQAPSLGETPQCAPPSSTTPAPAVGAQCWRVHSRSVGPWCRWPSRCGMAPRNERGGYKQLSAWHFLQLPSREPDPAYLKEVSFGYEAKELGEASKGKALAHAVCIACHHFPGMRLAPSGFAPDLSDIGAIATPSYLRDSLVTPSLVLVPGLQPNAHYAKNGKPDAFRGVSERRSVSLEHEGSKRAGGLQDARPSPT